MIKLVQDVKVTNGKYKKCNSDLEKADEKLRQDVSLARRDPEDRKFTESFLAVLASSTVNARSYVCHVMLITVLCSPA